jgi:LPXTG-site transpeptidase (sortase) family protein
VEVKEMFDSKYGNVLTALLVVVIIAIVGLLGFFGYDAYQKYFITKDTEEFVDSYSPDVVSNDDNENTTVEDDVDLEGINATATTDGTTGKTKLQTYKGFNVYGTIEIPKTNVKYPILEKVTKKSIETAVAILYGPGPNQPGNTVIVGHNYRNGLFFSNNKKLSNGDKIYITDYEGKKLTYTIYNKYETSPEDTEYMTRNTNGAREISLSTCTDDSSARLIIWAKADEDQ